MFALKNKLLIFVLFITIISTLFVVADKYNVDNAEKELIQVFFENCQVQDNPCVVTVDDLKIYISFEKNIYYLKPFNISISTLNTSDLTSIYVDFKMKNMDMGVNRFQLKRDPQKSGYWQGIALLPICVTGRADWYSELEVTTKKGRYQIILPIFVKQPAR